MRRTELGCNILVTLSNCLMTFNVVNGIQDITIKGLILVFQQIWLAYQAPVAVIFGRPLFRDSWIQELDPINLFMVNI